MSNLKMLEQVFTDLYHSEVWENVDGTQTRSGLGSTLEYSKCIRDILTCMLKEYSIKSILDASCGDWNWMSTIQYRIKCNYVGIDVVSEIIDRNTKLFSNDRFKFVKTDALSYLKTLPNKSVDLILFRNTAEYLDETYNLEFIGEARRVCRYLLMTTTDTCNENKDVDTVGCYRPINLKLPPYSDLLNSSIVESKYDGPIKIHCDEMRILFCKFGEDVI